MLQLSGNAKILDVFTLCPGGGGGGSGDGAPSTGYSRNLPIDLIY